MEPDQERELYKERVLKGEVQIPSHDEIEEKARGIKDPVEQAFFIVTYLTGGRINEILPKKDIVRTDSRHGPRLQWREPLNYPGIRRKDVEVIERNGRKLILFTMLNEKNQKQTMKRLPSPVDKEGPMVAMLERYLATKQPDDVLFRFSKCKGWHIMKRLGYNPHFLRHVRITHLITFYRLRRDMVIKYAGWSDDRPLRTYEHLFWTDIADEM